MDDRTLIVEFSKSPRPKIICLCGSTRFFKEFQEVGLEYTLKGYIVLSIGAAMKSDEEHFGHLTDEERDKIKADLDELHLRKIEMADEVYIINKGLYIGKSTSRELQYAHLLGKEIIYHERLNVKL